MSAIGKTKKLLRLDLPVALLEKNQDNPNKMSSREFDLLCDNIERTGLTDPILCRPINYTLLHDLATVLKGPDLIAAMLEKSVKVRIVGGHHRFDAASFLGFETVPVTVIMDAEFDDDQERFQVVRMNVIRGKMDPQRFFDMFNKMSGAYSDEVLQEAFGFADEAEFRKLIDQTAKSLPDAALQKKFKEAAAEVKTIDGLSKLLNEMFTKHGDTLPYGYMFLDFGGHRSIWVRVDKKTMEALGVLGDICVDRGRTMDDVLGGVVKAIAKGETAELLDKIVASTPQVDLPENLTVAPTKDNLQKVAGL